MGNSQAKTDAAAQKTLSADIKTIKRLFDSRLAIPEYQRAYTWTIKNVRQLVNDIRRFQSAGHYRIGTFILDASKTDSGKPHDIVDGQQRYISFALILIALAEEIREIADEATEKTDRNDVPAEKIEIPNRVDSADRILENSSYLNQEFARWTREQRLSFAKFLLNECSVVVLTVCDLDTAFQMFDSQNTRGLSLEPSDLLKAYHLRAFELTGPSEKQVLDIVQTWEATPNQINHILSGVLFPIIQWTRNERAPKAGFTSADLDLFKGVSGYSGNGRFPWTQPISLVRQTVERFNKEHATLIDHGQMEPMAIHFQLTLPIIDGEMFFEMIQHYLAQGQRAGISMPQEDALNYRSLSPVPELRRILKKLDGLPGDTGYRYVRQLFDCLLIAYIDRFGWHEIASAAKALAQYAYLIRLALHTVQTESVNKHARSNHDRVPFPVTGVKGNLFTKISLAQDPQVVTARPEPSLERDFINSKHYEHLSFLYHGSSTPEADRTAE